MSSTGAQIRELAPQLSPGAQISDGDLSPPRWSDFHSPKPAAVVDVATEDDVQKTVKFCVDNKIPFLAQAGGNGWAPFRDWPRDGGVLINLRALNGVSFDAARTEARVGGGAVFGELVAAAWAHGAQVMAGNCDTVGVLGTALGGGNGNLLGRCGFLCDQLLSVDVVLADGSRRTVTPPAGATDNDDDDDAADNADLWWAMRGAGANFGIATGAVLRARPLAHERNVAYKGALLFTEAHLEQLCRTLNDLELAPEMNFYIFFMVVNNAPCIMAALFYLGSEEEARRAFAPVFDLGPVMVQGGVLPYNVWNSTAAGMGLMGGRKPAYGASMNQLHPQTWVQVWDEYKKLVQDPAYSRSIVLCEAFSLKHALTLEPNGPGTAASFSARGIRFNSAALLWYDNDESLDPKALAFGTRVRQLWRETSGLPSAHTFMNCAFGDESNEMIYGASLDRLRRLKKKFDPNNVFRYWFNITV